MSFDRILATKEYGKFIIDKCNETESYKFSEYNSSVGELKQLIDTRYIDENIYEGKSCIVVASGGSVLDN